jgi:hypothetical protein
MENRDKIGQDLSSCILMVNIDSARELPVSTKYRIYSIVTLEHILYKLIKLQKVNNLDLHF